jgi:hypothetical protein
MTWKEFQEKYPDGGGFKITGVKDRQGDRIHTFKDGGKQE